MSKSADPWAEVIALWTAALTRSRGGDSEGARRALEVAYARCVQEISEKALWGSAGPLEPRIDARMASAVCLSAGRAALENKQLEQALERFWVGLRIMALEPDVGLKPALRLAFLEAMAHAASESLTPTSASLAALHAILAAHITQESPADRARRCLDRAGLQERSLGTDDHALVAHLEEARTAARVAGSVGLEACAIHRLGQRALARRDAEAAQIFLSEARRALDSINDQEGLAWLRLDRAKLLLLQGRLLAARAHCVRAHRQFKRFGGREGLLQVQATLRLVPLWWVLWVMLGGGKRQLAEGKARSA